MLTLPGWLMKTAVATQFYFYGPWGWSPVFHPYLAAARQPFHAATHVAPHCARAYRTFHIPYSHL